MELENLNTSHTLDLERDLTEILEKYHNFSFYIDSLYEKADNLKKIGVANIQDKIKNNIQELQETIYGIK